MEYAGFFVRFYKWEKMSFLLRPKKNASDLEKEWMDIHQRIYDGKYCADDLFELLDYLRTKMGTGHYEPVACLGNHAKNQGVVSERVSEILDETLNKMEGVKIWNRRKISAFGNKMDKETIQIDTYRQDIWDAATLKVLKKCLIPVEKRKQELVSNEITAPVLTNQDKRSLSKFIWSGILPFSTFTSSLIQYVPEEKVHIYLDVSGSMNDEIIRLVNLLFHFRRFLKKPIWVFSDRVKEADFRGQQLIFETSHGTRIEPVFDHIREHKITRALIVTDGYVDAMNDAMLTGIDCSGIQVLLSAGGNAEPFESAGINYTRLENIQTIKQNHS
jgi:hypothetical protein